MFHIEFEQEDDGRWIADVVDLPGVMAYGATRADALRAVQALALRVLAERVEKGEQPQTNPFTVQFIAAQPA